MNLRHRFPNLSVIGSLSLLGIVTQQHPTRAETEIPENIPFDKIFAVETNLPSKVLPPARAVIYSREKAQQNKFFTAESVMPCGFSNTNLLCFNKESEKLSPIDLEFLKNQEKIPQEPKSKSLAQLMMEKSKVLGRKNRAWKTTQKTQKPENSSSPYSLRPYKSKNSKQKFSRSDNLTDSLEFFSETAATPKSLQSSSEMADSTKNSSSQSSPPYSLPAYDLVDSVKFFSAASPTTNSSQPQEIADSTEVPTQISSEKTFRAPYSLRPYSASFTEEEPSEKTPAVLELVELWEPEDNITFPAYPTTTAQIERDNTILEPKKNSKEQAVSSSAKDLSLELTTEKAPNTSVLPIEQTVRRQIDAVKPRDLDNRQIAEVEITPVSQLENRQRSEVDITPVSQLDDIQPSDWAFQALHSLNDRYGINKANPKGGFRGNRALTRYEFASALQTTIEQINELVAQGSTPVISRDDIALLERLQEEFAAELTRLQGRVDALEVRTSELQANQFSTTTQLTGQVIFGVTGGSFSGDRIVDVTGREITTKQPNTTFVYRAALDFNTSFSGSDLLKIRLDAGSDGADDNAAGFLEPSLGSVLDFAAKPPVEQFGISRLFYTFSPLKNVTLSLGPKIVLSDYIDTNRYANLSFLDFSTQAFVNNYLLFPVQGLGAGAVISWNPGDGPFTARAGYIAAAANEPTSRDSTSFVPGLFPIGYTLYPNGGSTGGLFGDPYQGIAEVEYAPSKNFAVRLQYAFGNILGGQFNVFGANFEFAFSDRVALFGRYGHASYKDTTFGDINPSYWMLGLAFPDLFVRGAKAGIAVGQPFISRDVGNANQTNFEAFYNYPISNNIQITPVVQVITNPGNQESNGTVFTGTLRTVFSF